MATIEDLIGAEKNQGLWRERLTSLADRNDYTYEDICNVWDVGLQSVRKKIAAWRKDWPEIVDVTEGKPHIVHFTFTGAHEKAAPTINPTMFGERVVGEIRKKLFWLAEDAELDISRAGRWHVREQRGSLIIATPSGDRYQGRFDNGWLVTSLVKVRA